MKNGWKMHRLEEVCQKITDGSHFSPKTADKGFPYVTVRDIDNDLIDFANCKFIAAADYYQLLKNGCRPHKGDVLFSKDGTVGKVALIDYEKEFVVLSSLAIVRPDPSCIESAFLKWVLKSPAFLDEAVGKKTGAAIRRIILRNLKSIRIPVPPLPEQQRIVAILDEAFAGLANATANAEKNLQNARALFESYLQSVFTQRGPGWKEKRFEELIESNIIGLTKSSREQGEDKSFPYVKMNNITRDNRFDFSNFTCVDATTEEVSKFSLMDGDFLFNTRNSHELVGKSCIYEADSNDIVLYNNNIMRVRFRHGVDARFVLFAFSFKDVADELNALKSGTTNVSAIYFKNLKSLTIPIPSMTEQKMIAARLESLVAETQRLAAIYERKLTALDVLKKSLLHQAFNGQL